MRVKALLAAALYLFASAALGQGTQFPAGTVWGNDTAGQRPGKVSTVTAILDRAFGSTRGAILERGASAWNLITPGTTGLPFTSNGAGADPSYQRLGFPGLPQGGANTIYINPTAGTANMQAVAVPACANDGAHALVYINATGLQCASITVGGVGSVAADGGVITGTGAAITSSGTIYSEQMNPGGRLTLTASTPVTVADVTAATTVNYAPFTSRWVPINNGTVLRLYPFTSSDTDTVGLQIALGANWTLNTNYDVFAGLDSSTVRACTGPAWATSTGTGSDARGTGAGTTELQLFRGLWTNKVSMTCRYNNTTTFTCAVNQCTYLGSFRTVAAGQTEDSMAKRYVWNLYNQQPRKLRNVNETTVSWGYTSVTVRQANANAANQLDFMVGQTGGLLDAKVTITADVSAGGSFIGIGIGVNSTTVDSSEHRATLTACTNRCADGAILQDYPALGRSTWTWLEWAGLASGTNTYYGGSANYIQSGMAGIMWM